MNQTELMIALGAALFAAFLLGWLAGWLTHRAGGAAPAPAPDNDAVGRLAAAETAAAQAREELREAHLEIEELRAYIDRRLAKKPEA